MTTNRILNIAGVAISVILVFHLGNTYGHRLIPKPATRPVAPYKAGDRLIDTAELSLSHADITLILAGSSTCPYCIRSLPLYKELAAQLRTEHIARIVAVTEDDAGYYREYLRKHGLDIDGIGRLKANVGRVHNTPTVTLAGRDGTVLNCWVGEMDSKQEAEVLRAIKH